jgi:hypothetical protein
MVWRHHRRKLAPVEHYATILGGLYALFRFLTLRRKQRRARLLQQWYRRIDIHLTNCGEEIQRRLLNRPAPS